MTQKFKRLSLAVFAAGVLSQPINAQELAKEVVQEYFDQMTRTGMAVAPGSVSTTGKTVEWKDVTIGLPDGMGSYSLAFIRAEEIGGGKVSLSYPESMSFVIDPVGEQPQMNITMNSKGLKHIVSGIAAARDHNYSIQSMKMNLTSPKPGLVMDLNVSDLVGSQQYTMLGEGDAKFGHIVGSFKVATADLDYTITDDNVNAKTKMTYNNVSGSFDMDEVSQENLEALFGGDRNVSFDLAVDSTSGVMDINQPGAEVEIQMSTGAGNANYGVLDGIAQMSGVGYDAKYDVRMKSMPLPPFQLTMDKVDTVFNMPLKKTDSSLPARIQIGMHGLVASDTVWGMFDPTGQLPRDAANLNIDLSGKMRWLVDVMKATETQSVPVEMEAVTINDVTLEIAGAKFVGNGAAMLDNSTMPPMPVGAIDLDLKGGMGLLDKLVGMGLLPQQQSMMVKGMAGMFSVPGGNGADHLTSKIEMKEGGAILANGQRIK